MPDYQSYLKEFTDLFNKRTELSQPSESKLTDLEAMDDQLLSAARKYPQSLAFETLRSGKTFPGNPDFHAAMALMALTDPAVLVKAFVLENVNHSCHEATLKALCWASYQEMDKVLVRFAAQGTTLPRWLAMSINSAQGRDAGYPLSRAINDHDTALNLHAFKMASRMGRHEHREAICMAMESKDQEVRYWSARSALLLGEKDMALDVLEEFSRASSTHSEEALEFYLRGCDPDRTKRWLQQMLAEKTNDTKLTKGAVLSGDPIFIPHLLDLLEDQDTSQKAAKAFHAILGIDIGAEENADPASSDRDHFVTPQPQALRNRAIYWWQRLEKVYPQGYRYRLGKPINKEFCRDILCNGFQKDRAGAALDFALLDPANPLIDVEAPTHLQKRYLAMI